MKKLSILVMVLTFISSSVIIQASVPIDEQAELSRIKNEIAKRSQQMEQLFNNRSAVRSGLNDYAAVTVLTEEAIRYEAKKRSLTAIDDEVAAFLLPILARQDLVDITSNTDFRSDENVQTWLRGQGMTMAQLIEMGRIIVLWTKIAIANVEVSEQEVASYIEKNPEIRVVPERIKVNLTRYTPPPNLATRGVLSAELIAPRISPVLRSSAVEELTGAPKAWEVINLYLVLDQIDPNLRKVLSGKQVGDKFGPILLRSEAIVSGDVAAFLPKSDFARTPQFWQMAALRARLEKANQTQIFEAMVDQYLEAATPAIRGFWGRIWGGIKKGFGVIGGGIGGITGYFLGGPSGALLGAQYGYQIGNTIKGWITPPPVSDQYQNPWMNLPSLPPPPPLPYMRDYLQGTSYRVPDSYYYRRTPRVDWYPNYYDEVWGGQYSPYIPPMYENYPRVYKNWYDRLPSRPPSSPCWGPPIYMPFPVRYL